MARKGGRNIIIWKYVQPSRLNTFWLINHIKIWRERLSLKETHDFSPLNPFGWSRLYYVLCVCDMNRERRAMQSEICQSASGQRENFPSPFSHDS